MSERTSKRKRQDKVPFNLTMDEELKRQINIYCAATGEDVSTVTARLWKDYLSSGPDTKRGDKTVAATRSLLRSLLRSTESLACAAAEGWKITSLELKAACLVCAPLMLDATDGKLTLLGGLRLW